MSSFTASEIKYLQLFYNGLTCDVCIEVGNDLGVISPNSTDGLKLTQGMLRNLKAKGLITAKNTYIFSVEYKRFTISELGIKTIEEFNNEHSK
jgi:hypothetical protein